MHRMTETIAPSVTYCPGCESAQAPNGKCLNVGGCLQADSEATRGAARETAKYAVPAAWNARGYVD